MQIVSDVLVVVLLIMGTSFFGYKLRRGLKTGECWGQWGRITRAGHPIGYWAIIVILLVWLIVLPSVCIFFLLWQRVL